MAEKIKKETVETPETKTITRTRTKRVVVGPNEKEQKAAAKAKKVKKAVDDLINVLTATQTIEISEEEKEIVKKAVKKAAVKKTTASSKKVAAEKPATKTTKKATTTKTAKAEKEAKPTVKKTTTTKKVTEKPATKATKVTTEQPKEVKKETSTKTTKTVTKTKTTVKPTKEKANKKEAKKIILRFDNKKLPKNIFHLPKIYEQAIFDSIIAERASRRQGTHDVKSRAEVSGSGKKPWKQKGTGRARTGSLRTPVFVGGGRAFGPTPERNYKLKVNRKVRILALLSAFSLLAKDNAVVVDDLKLEKISTKELVKKLETLRINELRRILVLTNDEVVYRSANNLQNVVTVRPNAVSVESLIHADVLVLSKEALEILEGRFK